MLVNTTGNWWGTADKDGHNWNNGVFLLNEYVGAWGLNNYYDLYSEKGWWAMIGWLCFVTFLFPVELIAILIDWASGNLTTAGKDFDNMSEEEIAAAEAKAAGDSNMNMKDVKINLVSNDFKTEYVAENH